jgi:hypothetical protein
VCKKDRRERKLAAQGQIFKRPPNGPVNNPGWPHHMGLSGPAGVTGTPVMAGMAATADMAAMAETTGMTGSGFLRRFFLTGPARPLPMKALA